MGRARPDFIDSESFYVDDGWLLKEGAPEETQKEFETYMSIPDDIDAWYCRRLHTTHVETVALLIKLKESDSITVELNLDELEVSAPKIKATYSQIKEYVLNKYGFKISSLNIAQVKQECEIIERENYNKPSDNYKQPNCPMHKVAAIKEAFKHFKMINKTN